MDEITDFKNRGGRLMMRRLISPRRTASSLVAISSTARETARVQFVKAALDEARQILPQDEVQFFDRDMSR